MAEKRKAEDEFPARQLSKPFSESSATDILSQASDVVMIDVPSVPIKQEDDSEPRYDDPVAESVYRMITAKDEDVIMHDEKQEDKQAMLKALHGTPRGRKPGSGVGDKRKKDDEYSSNVHTAKARARVAGMNSYQKEIERSKNAASTWVSKEIKKYKQSAEYAAIPADLQASALQKKREALKKQREVQFNATSEKAIIQAILNKLQDNFDLAKELREQADVLELQGMGIQDDDDRYLVTEEDDSDIGDDNFEFQWKASHMGQAAMINEERIRCGIKEGLTEAFIKFNVRNMSVTDRLELSAFEIISARLCQILAQVGRKSDMLDMISSSAWHPSKGLSDQAALFEFKSVLKHFGVHRKGWSLPQQYFTKEELKVLRFIWGCDEDDWYTLPGPAAWWPDVNGDGTTDEDDKAANCFYKKFGFDVGRYTTRQYQKAAFVFGETPKDDWFNHLNKARDEIVWL